MNSHISGWDIAVVVAYFFVILGISVFTMFFHKRNTIDSYFLAGRNMIWLFVGASLFASNIGSEHFIGLAGSGAASGIGVGAFEFNAMLILQLLGWVYLPVFLSSGVHTLPEYMNKRFGGHRIRIYLSVLSLILYIFTKISVNLYSGALFIKLALGWDLYYSVLLILAMTAFSTIVGGLTAVIYTDTIQALIMVFGGITLMAISFAKIGSYEDLYVAYMEAVPESVKNASLQPGAESNPYLKCGIPNPKAFQMLRGLDDPDMPWLGFLLGQTPASIWYWCSDQMMVQRALAAKTLSHAQGGTLLAGYIKILPLFMMVMPGMISRALFKDTVGCADPETCRKVCDSSNGCSNLAYPMLIMELMPVGLKGLMIAVMLSALMSDLTSIFNSSSVLFTVDIYKQVRKHPSDKELMIIGRLFVVFMLGVGIAWIPIIKNMQGGQLYIYIQSVGAYLSPPIAAVYLLAVLWKRGNEKGAFWALMMGMIIGMTRMILDFIFYEPPCGEEDTRPGFIKNFHYMYFAIMLFWVTIISMVVISLLTKEPDSYRLIRTTFWTRRDRSKREDEIGDYERRVNIEAADNHAAKFDPNELDQEVEIDVEKRTAYWKPRVNKISPPVEKAEANSSFTGILKKHFLSLICGVEGNHDNSFENMQRLKQLEHEQRVRNFESLKQTKFEKIVLSVSLGIILSIAVGLFIFFSIPPQLHIFKNVSYNQTIIA